MNLNSSAKPVRFAMLTQSHRAEVEKRQKLASARGEVTDSWRQLALDILKQVPSLTKVPEKQQGIHKEVLGADHNAYWYTEKLPTGGWVTVEFHVDPTSGWTEIYVQSEYDGKVLDHFTIEDLEDYSPGEIDRIDTAVSSFNDYWKEVQERQPGKEPMTASVKRVKSSVSGSD